MKKETITLTIDDREIEVEEGSTVLQAARKLGIWIPTLCQHDALELQGACRLCIVEVEGPGGRRIMASCAYPAADDLKVFTNTEKVAETRNVVAELLLARCSENEQVKELCAKIGVTETPFTKKKEDCVLCGLCVRICHDMMKTGAISFIGRGGARKIGTPYDEYSDVCITCGACEKICPTGAITAKMSSGNDPIPFGKKFEENLISRGSIDIPFPSAVPLLPSIDRDNCIQFQISDDACGMCQNACPAEAIDFSQTVMEKNIEVGSIITAPGFEAFDPSGVGAYAYDSQPDVITSMEFERMLSAGGPFAGHVHRLSDGKEPKKIAWLQCVGSRDMSEGAKAYCSSVCCMYALKQAMIAKEHVGEGLDTSIFFIDMRTFGTDFEKYLERAKEQGVRLIRSRVRTVTPVGNNGDLNIRYLAETGEIIEENEPYLRYD